MGLLSRKYFKLPNHIIEQYQSAFRRKSNEDIFRFLKCYLKYLESDNGTYRQLFLIGNPNEDMERHERIIKELNKNVGDFLGRLMRDKNGGDDPYYKEGEVVCYWAVGYEYGIFNLEKSHEKAFHFYTISAQLNCDMGTFRLARAYEKGIGCERDFNRAGYFFRCAAKYGIVEALHAYGSILMNGTFFCKQDIKLGLHYTMCASYLATPIYPYPYYDLGFWYENKVSDEDGAAEHDYAMTLYQKGANIGDPNCQSRLADAYFTGNLDCIKKTDRKKAIELYKQSAVRGQIRSQMKLSELYYIGEDMGNESQSTQSLSYYWALRAACKRDKDGAYILGEYCYQGFGVRKDILLSLWWFRIAESFGSDRAHEKVNELNVIIEGSNKGIEMATEKLCCEPSGWFC